MAAAEAEEDEAKEYQEVVDLGFEAAYKAIEEQRDLFKGNQ
mgnify:CR=1 FL=1